MATDYSCASINQQFEANTNLFMPEVREKLYQTDPWARLQKTEAYPLGQGVTHRELLMERIDTYSSETDWATITESDGSNTSNACLPTSTDLAFGNTVRSWNLQTKSYKTPCLCLEDLKSRFQVEQQIGKTVKMLTQLTGRVTANRCRAEYARLVNKVTIRPGFAENSTDHMINGTVTPTSWLTQSALDEWYPRLLLEGAGTNTVAANMDGAPTLTLITSRETSDHIIRESGIRGDFQFGDPGELLKPLGVNRVYKGWAHIIDPELPRFDIVAGAWVRRLPYVTSSASQGSKAVPNPDYFTAGYEMSYAYHPDVYTTSVQQVGPNIPGASFEDHPYYYNGTAFWLNIQHPVSNPLKTIGFWMLKFQNGSRPNDPTLGRVFVSKRCPNDQSFVGCSY